MEWLAKAAIWIGITVLPVVLLVFGPPALIVWVIMRRRAKAKKAAQPSTVAITPDQKS